MPCSRMHCATLSMRAIVCADGCVVEPGPSSPPGISFWHFAWAALNVGEEGFRPGADAEPAARVWVREARHAVGTHALGEREHLLFDARVALRRRRGAVVARR